MKKAPGDDTGGRSFLFFSVIFYVFLHRFAQNCVDLVAVVLDTLPELLQQILPYLHRLVCHVSGIPLYICFSLSF